MNYPEKLTLLPDSDPILRSISEPVSLFDDELKSFADKMVAAMNDFGGIGLASPQVGVSRRLIVVRVGSGKNHKDKILINPEIISSNGFRLGEEGCLSLPGQRVKKMRKMNVKVKAQRIDGSVFNLTLSGLEAACVQHEIDHLNGKLMIDP